MAQFIGSVRDDTSVRGVLVSVAPPTIRAAAAGLELAVAASMEIDDEPAQMAYAQVLADWVDAEGYELDILPAMNDQDSHRSPGGSVLRFALHRQGQNSHVSTRCHAHALPRFNAGTAKQCRAWLSPNRPERTTFHRQAERFVSDEPVWDEGQVISGT